MQPFRLFPDKVKSSIRYILTDIDDTLTVKGQLYGTVLSAMERLQTKGIMVIPITGRPAGWCDHIARMWPVDGLVGENGAFYFHYDRKKQKMLRRFAKSKTERIDDRKKLEAIKTTILEEVPGCQVSSDQAYREADLAIDFCEDVPALPMDAVHRIKNIFVAAGAQAKISSIHVNGWFGRYDKLSMTRLLFHEVFGRSIDDFREDILFSGDSPNDAPMFAYFPHGVGVANVLRFKEEMHHEPAWVTEKEGGHGFIEMVEQLLGSRIC